MSIANLIYPALSIINMLQQNQRSSVVKDKYEELQAKIEQLQNALPSSEVPTAPAVKVPNVITEQVSMRDLQDSMVSISRDLDEALRFARDDGVDHPESQLRTKNAEKVSNDLQDRIIAIERMNLSPSSISGVSMDEKKVIDHVLPQIRKLRQGIVNNMDSVDGIEKSAAMANQIATQLKVANAVMAAKDSGEPYSKYAPEMTIDTGCIECGRAHIAMADIALREAAKAASDHGFTSPATQSKITLAEQELSALCAWDWTDDKISKSMGREKDVLIEYNPQIKEMYQRVSNLGSKAELDKAAKDMTMTRANFQEALQS